MNDHRITLAMELHARAAALLNQNQIAEALVCCQRSLAIFLEVDGPESLDVGNTSYLLSTIRDRQEAALRSVGTAQAAAAASPDRAPATDTSKRSAWPVASASSLVGQEAALRSVDTAQPDRAPATDTSKRSTWPAIPGTSRGSQEAALGPVDTAKAAAATSPDRTSAADTSRRSSWPAMPGTSRSSQEAALHPVDTAKAAAATSSGRLPGSSRVNMPRPDFASDASTKTSSEPSAPPIQR
jgi:hypothetical protein